jgi:hypothetical protein
MSLRIEPFEASLTSVWDCFCEKAINATLLHTRKFLSYHQDRFKDLSLLVYKDDTLVGLLPAAEHPSDASMVVSHPGATYGGLVHSGYLTGERTIEALTAAASFYRARGYGALLYKALPYTYTSIPSQDDLYALFRLGASRVRCDLSSTVSLSERLPLPDRRRRALKKAQGQVKIHWDTQQWPAMWGLIAENLARKHQASPVHSADELMELHRRFPDEIRMVLATHGDGNDVAAGVVLFNSRLVWHAQYIAASELGYAANALDAVFDAVIALARDAGARYFDFGTSNEDGGRVLNTGLYRFKTEFGGGGVAHEFYLLNFESL